MMQLLQIMLLSKKKTLTSCAIPYPKEIIVPHKPYGVPHSKSEKFQCDKKKIVAFLC